MEFRAKRLSFLTLWRLHKMLSPSGWECLTLARVCVACVCVCMCVKENLINNSFQNASSFLALPFPILSGTLQSLWCVYLIGSNTKLGHLEGKWFSGAKVRGWGSEWHLSLALPQFARMEGWMLHVVALCEGCGAMTWLDSKYRWNLLFSWKRLSDGVMSGKRLCDGCFRWAHVCSSPVFC